LIPTETFYRTNYFEEKVSMLRKSNVNSLMCGAFALILSSASLIAQTAQPSTGNTSAPATAPVAAPATAAVAAPAQKGMVWVNTASGAYHREGTRYYGKTKQGKYMAEADAQKAGYHLSKSDAKK
jgi:hypothetical protein